MFYLSAQILLSAQFLYLLYLMNHISVNYIQAPAILYKDHMHAFKLKWWLSHQSVKNKVSPRILRAIAANDDHETFLFVMKHGFDINTRDEEGNNILMLALTYHSTKLVSTIVSFLKSDPCLGLDAINHKGHQALSIAILQTHEIEVIKDLLTLGANPNHYLYNNSIHPALAAIMSNQMPLLDALVSSQQFNLDQQLSQTLFSLIEQQPKVVGYYATLISRYHWLKDRVSNPYTRWVIYDEDKPSIASHAINEKDAFGLTALHYAIILNKPNLIKQLISYPTFNASLSENNANIGLLEIMFSSGHLSLYKDIVNLKDIKLPSDMYRTDYVKLLLNIGGDKRFQHLASLFEGRCLYSPSHIDIAFSHERFKTYFLKHMDEFTGNSFVSRNMHFALNTGNMTDGLFQLCLSATLYNKYDNFLTDLDQAINCSAPDNEVQTSLKKITHGLFMREVCPYLNYQEFKAVEAAYCLDVSRGTPS